MRSLSVFMIFQTAVISSLVHGSHGDRGCTGFTFDPSPYEDDSDYQDGASGSNNFDIGDDLKLRTHVTNNWELRVNWNASRYQSLAPSDGWNYMIHVAVKTSYQTPSGSTAFATSSEIVTKKNRAIFPLYNPSATYTITVLAATTTGPCLGQRKVVNDLPGREDAIMFFQLRLKFYTYASCERKLRKKHRILPQFSQGVFDALKEHQDRFGTSYVQLSNYSLIDLDVICLRDGYEDSRTAMFTGRIVATGNASNTMFIEAMQSWIETQPTLPIHKDSVVVDKTCPVHYTPSSGGYCAEPNTNIQDILKPSDSSGNINSSNGYVIGIATIAGVSLVILLALGIFVCVRSRHKMCARAASISFRSQENVSRRLRINNVLADIESIDCSSSSSPENSTSDELHQNSTDQYSKRT